MPSQEPYLDLTLYDAVSDKTETFLNFRNDIAGTSNSNFIKIGNGYNALDTKIDSTATTTLSSAKAYADTVSATAKTEAIAETQTWAKGTFTRKNLLIDGDFQLWLDGTNFVAPSNRYTATMWKCNGAGTVTKVANGMQITGTVTVMQIMEALEYNKISGKTVTLSYSLNGVITTSTYAASSATVVNLIVTDKIINWIKLEEGDFRTPFESKPYGELLETSKRYCRVFNRTVTNGFFIKYVSTVSTVSYFIVQNGYFDVEMRAIPTITVSNNLIYTFSSASTGVTFDLTGRTDTNGLNTAKSNSALPDGTYILQGTFIFDSRL